MQIVLDNSVTTGWVHPDQATPYSTALLDGLSRYRPVAPALWTLEFSNALLVLQRRRKLSAGQRQSALATAESWGIALDAEWPGLAAVSDLADRHGLSTYDAAYLDCALRRRLRLATQDAGLKKAAQAQDCWFDARTFKVADPK